MKLLMTLLTILLIQGCAMFDKEESLLAEHTKANGEKIKIYYVGLGATTNDVIQVKKSNKNEPLWVSDKYNCLISSMLVNDSTLQMILSDTSYHNNTKMDTLIVNVR
jgi:hypothetical protein